MLQSTISISKNEISTHSNFVHFLLAYQFQYVSFPSLVTNVFQLSQNVFNWTMSLSPHSINSRNALWSYWKWVTLLKWDIKHMLHIWYTWRETVVLMAMLSTWNKIYNMKYLFTLNFIRMFLIWGFKVYEKISHLSV